jgi:hypothetical protein
MARSQLQQATDAQEALDRLRELLQSGQWADDREARSFLREAENVARDDKD